MWFHLYSRCASKRLRSVLKGLISKSPFTHGTHISVEFIVCIWLVPHGPSFREAPSTVQQMNTDLISSFQVPEPINFVCSSSFKRSEWPKSNSFHYKRIESSAFHCGFALHIFIEFWFTRHVISNWFAFTVCWEDLVFLFESLDSENIFQDLGLFSLFLKWSIRGAGFSQSSDKMPFASMSPIEDQSILLMRPLILQVESLSSLSVILI